MPTTDDPAGRRVSGAIRPSAVDNLALVRTAWDVGAPLNTVVWYFRLVGAGEIRVIDIDRDLDIGPVERVARILVKGYFYGSHFLPHDALATQKIGRTFLTELKEAADVLCGTNASNSSNASFQPVLVMSDILIAAIGVPMWIVTLPWNVVLGAILEKIIPGVFDRTIVPGLLIAAVSAIANVAILWSIENALKRRKAKV